MDIYQFQAGRLPCAAAAVFVVFLFGGAAGAAADQELGRIEYIESPEDVSLIRNGESLAEDVTFGTPVENYDKISTGASGMVQIRLDGAKTVDSVVTVQPSSSFILEVAGGDDSGGSTAGSSSTGGSRAGISLLAGSLQFKVNKLAGQEQFDVSTENTVMGVRGTEFRVDGTPGGEFLVSCTEGLVACVDEDDQELQAEPGQVVQKLTLGEEAEDNGFSAKDISVSGLDEFRTSWRSDRMEVLRGQAGRAVEDYMDRFELLRKDFDRYYARLPREILSKWERRERRGEFGSSRELMADKKKVFGPLKELKIVMTRLAPVFYRLRELQGYYEELGRSHDDLNRFTEDAAALEEKMDRVGFFFKLYAQRNGGSFPLDFGGSTWDLEGEGDFMEGNGDFFH